MEIIVKSGTSFGRSTQTRDAKEWFSFDESVEIHEQTDLTAGTSDYEALHTTLSQLADALVRRRIKERLEDYNRRREEIRGGSHG